MECKSKKVPMVVSFEKISRITAQRMINYYSNILTADVKITCRGSGRENLCCAFEIQHRNKQGRPWDQILSFPRLIMNEIMGLFLACQKYFCFCFDWYFGFLQFWFSPFEMTPHGLITYSGLGQYKPDSTLHSRSFTDFYKYPCVMSTLNPQYDVNLLSL